MEDNSSAPLGTMIPGDAVYIAHPPAGIFHGSLVYIAPLVLAGMIAISGDSMLYPFKKVLVFLYEKLRGLYFLFNGISVIERAYKKANGKPFRVFAFDHNYVFVTSPEHYREVIKAKAADLSLYAASRRMWQPLYTMHRFNWVDIRGGEGLGYVTALGTMLTNYLPSLMPDLRRLSAYAIDTVLSQHAKADGTFVAAPACILRRVICMLNANAFFGVELGANQAFIDSAYDYTNFVIVSAEMLRLLPEFVKPLAGFVIDRLYSGVQASVFHAIDDVVARRLDNLEGAHAGVEAPNDFIQWMIDTAPKGKKWSSTRITYEIIGIWFGSVHATSITVTQALLDLCRHPGYVEPLRAEIMSSELDKLISEAKGMPLLDSFIKESARMSSADAMSVRRAALRDWTFQDGTVVKKGEWVGIPQQAIMMDEANFPEANKFNGFRFVHPALLETLDANLGRVRQPEGPSRLTDVSRQYPVWGTRRDPCPGRFYVANALKVVLIELLDKYDFEVQGRDWFRNFTWRTYLFPSEFTKMVFTRREGKLE